MNVKKTILCTSALLGSVLMTAQNTGWYTPTVENKPFVRWWWLGSAVDREGLSYNLEEFAKAGIGGYEVTPIYGVKGNEQNDIQSVLFSEEQIPSTCPLNGWRCIPSW